MTVLEYVPFVRDIGVVCALPAEAATLGCKRAQIGQIVERGGLRLIVAGVGAQRAQAAAERLLAAGAGALVSWGVAGGLRDGLAPGALLVPEQIRDHCGSEHATTDWRTALVQAMRRAGLAVDDGALWCADQVVVALAEKRQLAACAAAVDMESMGVARAAMAARVPFVAVKAICDPATQVPPPNLLRDDGSVRVAGVAAALARGPRMWRALRHMGRDFHTACDALREAAAVLPLEWRHD